MLPTLAAAVNSLPDVRLAVCKMRACDVHQGALDDHTTTASGAADQFASQHLLLLLD
jgi:hypothetical protein